MQGQHEGLFNQSMLDKYGMSGPRYTSYPTALEFNTEFTDREFRKAALLAANPELAIYIHVPFCHSLCYYCGCNKIITRNRDKIAQYVDYLKKEIILRSELFKNHHVIQIHFGGGTPGMLSLEEVKDILSTIKSHYKLDELPEISLEIDPRETTVEYISGLAFLGVNRISMGVQDTDKQVQIAINRIQPTELVSRLSAGAKTAGIKSINLDLVYGLPLQTSPGFEQTIEDVLNINPDRISLFNYAHMPQKFAAQRKIKDSWLPGPEDKLKLMRLAIERFTEAGYRMIGIDHFAKPDDELAIALDEKRLGRNFQGYTTLQYTDLVGFGVSAISSVCNVYSQNSKNPVDYYQMLDEQQHAIERGLVKSEEDQLRGYIITHLMTNLRLDVEDVEELFEVSFAEHFKTELVLLKTFEEDNLIKMTEQAIIVNPDSRLLLRSICMVFDQYMAKHKAAQRFSKVV
ncbi:oxygen-independent coproporphyrinogen III oxidase [Planctobacterium marinum]|uniref:Coproporphyrinogen-III oxidase n=1 Tax=Planctobacterium marinum TaxID=1631968 RepID=A0AA48KP27_9ALTE|nr:coproporphyrinogen-III oxidase [Planctobacterium marinum]